MEHSPIILAHEPAFTIGEAEFRPATREFVAGGKASVVEPRVMQVLVALHHAQGSVITKDDLVQRCWDGRVVGEDAINRVISRLRQNAARDAAGQFRVETITRVGYRLIPAGAGSAAASESIGAGPAAASESGGAVPIDRRQAIGAGLAMTAVAGGLGWLLLRPDPLPDEAARLIEQGRAELSGATVEQVTNAVARFRLATELAPDSAEAWGALALAYQRQLAIAPSDQGSIIVQKARTARERALALDPGNGDAAAAGVLAVPLRGNWLAYERRCREAHNRHPGHPEINFALGICLAEVGRGRAALPFVERARQVGDDPRHFIYSTALLWDQGRLDEAEDVVHRAAEQWPRHASLWFTRLYFLAFNNRASEALAMVQGASRPTGIPEWNFELTGLQAKALLTRSAADAEAAMGALKDAARKGVGFTENAIIFASLFGMLDQAFELIDAYFFDRGFAVGETRFAREQGLFTRRGLRHSYFLFRSLTRPLRADPRFALLLRELGLEEYWRRSGTSPDFRVHG